MTRLLAIDPGQSIGWALFEDDHVRAVGTSSTPVFEMWDGFNPDIVVIEFVLSITNSHLGQYLTELGSELKRHYPAAVYVRPGQWKPRMKSVKLMLGLTKTKHEQDAVRMGMWWIQRADRT